MFDVKIRGKEVAKGSIGVTFMENHLIIDGNKRIELPKAGRLRIEVYGDVRSANVSNCCSVEGSVQEAIVCNQVRCDGFIGACISKYWEGSRVDVDREAFVYFGRDADYWGALQSGGRVSKERVTVIRIEGILGYFNYSVPSMEVHPEIHGSVGRIEVGNCLYVRGTVKYSEASHGVATMNMNPARPNPCSLYKKKMNELYPV